MINLISLTDYLLLVIYSLIVFFSLKKFALKNLEPIYYKLFDLFFVFKIFAIIAYTLMITYYWKLADSVNVYQETQNLVDLIKQDISNLRYIFLPVEEYNSVIKLDSKLVTVHGGAGVESNFFLTRVCTLFYPLALGKYVLINFWFAVFSAIAQFKLYLVLIRVYPEISQRLAIGILFMPMLVFYSSPIYKETICLALLAFAITSGYNFLNKKNQAANVVIFCICVFLISLVKIYVFYGVVIAVALAYIIKVLVRISKTGLLGNFFIILFIVSMVVLLINRISSFEPYILSMVDLSNFNQQIYSSENGETSAFEFGEIETSISGFLSNIPYALYTTYFRPHLWEITKPILLLSAIESAACFLLLCYAIIKKGRNFFFILQKNTFTLVIFLFVIILGTLIGITTFNFGTLVRYKVPVVPFIWVIIFLLLDSEKPAKKISL